MNRTECENKILLLLAEIANIYKEYNPDGDYLTLYVCDNFLSVNNDYWEWPNNEINAQRKVDEYKDTTFFNFEGAWELEKKKVRADTLAAVSRAMYHEAFEVSHEKDGMQKWDSGNWIRYKLFENVIEELGA